MKENHFFTLPNILSISRIPLGIIFFFLFFFMQNGHFSPFTNLVLKTVSLLVFLAAIITDALDGYFARKLHVVTNIGKHLDPFADCLFFILVFFTFMVADLMHPIFFFIILTREIIMHLFLRPYVKSRGKSLPASIFGKLKTLFQCILSLILLFLLILKQFFQLFSADVTFINKVLAFSAPLFFGLIAILSATSLLIYFLQLKKILTAEE